MEYASKAVGTAALTTGIIGTSLGAIASAGGVAGILGLGGRQASADPGDRPVTRYELGLIQDINAKNDEIVGLKAAQYTDGKAAGLQAQISEQAVFNATAVATMGSIQQQVTALQGITRLYVPNENVAPGWGPAQVRPFPPFPPFPPVNTAPTVQGSTSTGGTDVASNG